MDGDKGVRLGLGWAHGGMDPEKCPNEKPAEKVLIQGPTSSPILSFFGGEGGRGGSLLKWHFNTLLF